MSLSAKNFNRLIVIDEAHSVAQDRRDFCPEFKSAVVTLRKINDNSPTPCNFLAMSATFLQEDQDKISTLWTRPPDRVIWRELSRCGIAFDIVISGGPTLSIVRSLTEDYRYPTKMKTIVYTNSKTLAMGSLTTVLENMLEKCEDSWRRMGHESFLPGRVISFTGNDGLQSKVFVMRVRASNVSDDDNTDEELPNLLIMPATKATDCGVSSNLCCRSYRVGVASLLYSIVQEMGRIDQVPLGNDVELSPNQYEVHLSFTCAVKLYVRIMQHPEKTERKRQLDSMMSVLSFLVVPIDCQQVILERYFDDQNATHCPEPCLNSCSKC
jgi:hypothetical protein